MNKKALLCVLALVMVYTAYAQQKYDDENDFRVSPVDGGKSAVITSYVGKKQTVNIPPHIQGMTVTGIGNNAFSRKEIIRITIPKSVTAIGNSAFMNNPLTSITFPAGLKEIGIIAFSDCKNLTSITIPASVTSIGRGAFLYCESLTGITVDKNNPMYTSEGGILYNKAKTTLIQAPQGISGVVTIPASVASIDYSAFSRCTGLTGITLPAGVTSIGEAVFSRCTGLTSITIPAGVMSIGSFAFADWTSSQTIYVQGFASQAAADAQWGELMLGFSSTNWRQNEPGYNVYAKIVYLGGN